MNKILDNYFSTNIIIKAFFAVFLLSNFLFFEFFGLNLHIVSLILSFFGFTILLNSSRESFFWAGFFIGLFWFYWISFSFIYYGFWYLLPLGIIIISLIYGFMFLFLASFSKNVFIKALAVFAVSFIHPFSFNWLDFRVLLVSSSLRVDYVALFCLILSCAVFLHFKSKFKFLFILVLLMINIDSNNKNINYLPFDTKIIQTNINQAQKWQKENLSSQIEANLIEINKAINNQKELIILPESAFAMILNKQKTLISELKSLSLKAHIITGGLTYENGSFYNSTYVFSKGDMQIFHKHILVPFGEIIPAPKFIRDFINDIFYGGAEDFGVAKNVSDYEINGVKIRNAICFEASRDELFVNNPKFMIAISNNGWFMPSSEALFQNSLLKMYASLYNTTIYHSANMSQSRIITPKNGGYLGSFKDYLLEFLKSSKSLISSKLSQG